MKITFYTECTKDTVCRIQYTICNFNMDPQKFNGKYSKQYT